MLKRVKLWIVSQQLHNKNHEFLPQKAKEMFSKINVSDILMIYCHGSPKAGSSGPSLWLKNNRGEISKKSKKKISEVEYSPKQFFDYSSLHGLNENHKLLKLVACDSYDFAKELSSLCSEKYPHLVIVGYKGQVVIGQGSDGRILAGLEPPLVKKENEEKELKEDEYDAWVINDDAFKANESANLVKYDEKVQQIMCKNGAEMGNKSADIAEGKDIPAESAINSVSFSNSTEKILTAIGFKKTASRALADEEKMPRSLHDFPANQSKIIIPRRYSTSSVKDPQPNNTIVNNQTDASLVSYSNALDPNSDAKTAVDRQGDNDIIPVITRRKSF